MLSNVQVVPGATAVARFAEVLLWFETGPQGGGVMLTQLLQAVQAVSAGSVPSHQMGASLAAVLNTGDATAVPALVATIPEGEGLRVVVHGWGALAADGVHLPNGWADEVVPQRSSYFLGRNTALTTAPLEANGLDGVQAGDGLRFGLTAAIPTADRHHEPPAGPPPAQTSSPGAAPVAWPPPTTPPLETPAPAPSAAPSAAPTPAPAPAPAPNTSAPTTPAPTATPWAAPDAPPSVAPPPPPGPATAPPPAADWSGAVPPPPPGRLVLDDGSVAVLERSCVLGSTPEASPAVQTGVAVPLTVTGPGVAGVHAEIRVEQEQVAVRDLGSAATYVLPNGAQRWAPLTPGQLTPLVPGSRIALGQRTIAYEQP